MTVGKNSNKNFTLFVNLRGSTLSQPTYLSNEFWDSLDRTKTHYIQDINWLGGTIPKHFHFPLKCTLEFCVLCAWDASTQVGDFSIYTGLPSSTVHYSWAIGVLPEHTSY